MANIIGNGLGEIQGAIAKVQSHEVFTSPLNKLWRLLILGNRAMSPMTKDASNLTYKLADVQNAHLAKEGSNSIAQTKDPWMVNKIAAKTMGVEPSEMLEFSAVDHTLLKSSPLKPFKNDVIIVNTNTSPATSLVIQNRPSELAVDPGTSWTSVKSFGRNNSYQIYNGSEDQISFEVSWYATMENRADVIAKCRLLESWSKADGYSSSPPILSLLWGNSGLFDGHEYILINASYKLSNFQDACAKRNSEDYTKLTATDLKLMPNCATQTLVFKRVSGKNLTHDDMVSRDSIKGIPGIKLE